MNNMSITFSQINYLQQMFAAEMRKPKRNYTMCVKLMIQIKKATNSLNFLPTTNVNENPEEYNSARQILEIGILCNIGMRDIQSFERYMDRLKCYYLDYSDILPESPNKYHILGLNLLFLLSQNRVAEYHKELILLPHNIIQTNEYIQYSIALEKCLIEGSYNKIYLAKNNAPANTYIYFTTLLIKTFRDDIADCIEKSYKKIYITATTDMLAFENINEMNAFANNRKWTLGENLHYIFQCDGEEITK